jgi:PIN domain nuclease of toxin-antitoxin system
MKLLLDTHTLLWYFLADPQLSMTVQQMIQDLRNEPFVSVASLWEMAIKVRSGKRCVPGAFETVIIAQLQTHHFGVWSVRPEHTVAISQLALHHKDPFDRMLAVQSLGDNLPLLRVDQIFDQSGVQRIW